MSSNWKNLREPRPLLGLWTRTLIQPILKNGRSARLTSCLLDFEAPCREELLADLYEELSGSCWDEKDTGLPGNWRKYRPTKIASLTIDDPSLKQPGVTYLNMGGEGIFDDGEDFRPCERDCCLSPLLYTMDAVVGLPALLLNPERYTGNWWETSPREFLQDEEIRWYGTDNFFLRHSSLTSMILGLFRQAYVIHLANLNRDLEKLAPRKEVVQALKDSDPERGLYLARRIRELIAPPRQAGYFPLGNNWDLFVNLHRAIYKRGYDEVFNGTIEDAWSLGDRASGKGVIEYFGRGARTNEAGKRVARLAR